MSDSEKELHQKFVYYGAKAKEAKKKFEKLLKLIKDPKIRDDLKKEYADLY